MDKKQYSILDPKNYRSMFARLMFHVLILFVSVFQRKLPPAHLAIILYNLYQPFSMSTHTYMSAHSITAILAATAFASYTLWAIVSPRIKRQSVRQKLPKSLESWRGGPGRHVDQDKLWGNLECVFQQAGMSLWNSNGWIMLSPGEKHASYSGYGYVTPIIRSNNGGPGAINKLRSFKDISNLQRPARTKEGLDVVIRVIVIRNTGQDHLKILRRLATGHHSFFTSNHTLPMFAELQFEDITFGIFPKVGWTVADMHGLWARNSMYDIVEMIMQMLEGLAYIHNMNIAHRDTFTSNWVIQWHPESVMEMEISPSRPRVYLIDFEVAVEFPPDCPLEECLTIGYPIGGSFPDISGYSRPCPPECASGEPYSPFKLDVWQLATGLMEYKSFKTTITDIDAVLLDMTEPDWVQRPDAKQALDRIRKVVYSMTPYSLLFPSPLSWEDTPEIYRAECPPEENVQTPQTVSQ